MQIRVFEGELEQNLLFKETFSDALKVHYGLFNVGFMRYGIDSQCVTTVEYQNGS